MTKRDCLNPRELLALSDAEVNARLARAMGWRHYEITHPNGSTSTFVQFSDDGLADWLNRQLSIPWRYVDSGNEENAPDFCSPDSPRRLLEQVEEWLEDHRKFSEYALTVCELMRLPDYIAEMQQIAIAVLTAPPGVLARAALAVLEGHKHVAR